MKLEITKSQIEVIRATEGQILHNIRKYNCLHIYSYEAEGTNTITYRPLRSLEDYGGQT